jgi:lipid-A-disaccharide synthase
MAHEVGCGRQRVMDQPKILISAGEASGELYAARLAAALKARTGAQLFGLGGERMREAGVDLVADYHTMSVVGITEVVEKLPVVWRNWRAIEKEAARRSPKLAILVDSPGFNLGLGRRLRKQGIPVVYFIGPQVWAWRRGRVKTIKRLVERILVIIPFEEKIYRDAGVPVDFVGHPLVDVVHPTMSRSEFAARHGLDPGRLTLALLPGSRLGEIQRHLPILLEACGRLARDPAPQFVLAATPGVAATASALCAASGLPVKVVQGETYNALAASDCAIVSSGTATVEAALLGTPIAVVYRVSTLTGLILRFMLHTPFIGMVNLIAGKQIVPELIQDQFTPAAVEREARCLLASEAARQNVRSGLAEVREKLGPGGAIDRAAEIIARML